MAFAGQQPRCRVKADPACAGQIDLAPGMQIGEILVRARWSVNARPDRASTGSDSLTQTAPQSRDCAGPAPAANWYRGTTPCPRVSVCFGVCTPGLHADNVIDFLRQPGIQTTTKSTVRCRAAVNRFQECLQKWPDRLLRPVDHQIRRDIVGIVKGPCLRRTLLDKEVETDCRRSYRRSDRPRSSVHHRVWETQTGPANCRRGLADSSQNDRTVTTRRLCEITRVRLCGAGRRRTICGPRVTGRSYL